MGHDQRTQPVARSDLRTHDSSSNLGSPPGSLDPSGSKPQPDVRITKLTLAGRPIFLHSPRRGNNFSHHSALRINVPDPLLPARLAVLRPDRPVHVCVARVRSQTQPGWCFIDDSEGAETPSLQSPSYTTQVGSKPNTILHLWLRGSFLLTAVTSHLHDE
jgi:hypothetical protein